MSEASKSQIAFARAIVRYAMFQFAFNVVPVAWAIWAFIVGMPNDWYWPSLWGALAIYVTGAVYLGATILIPAIRTRIAERDREKG